MAVSPAVKRLRRRLTAWSVVLLAIGVVLLVVSAGDASVVVLGVVALAAAAVMFVMLVWLSYQQGRAGQ
jgi:hypothetical protein